MNLAHVKNQTFSCLSPVKCTFGVSLAASRVVESELAADGPPGPGPGPGPLRRSTPGDLGPKRRQVQLKNLWVEGQKMNCPPTKRLRGLNHDVVANFADPFGDDEDFSQADLDEIDIIASQAITSATAGGAGPGSRAGGQNRPPSRAAANQSRGNGIGFNSKGNSGIPSREPLGNRQQQFSSDRQDYSLLETQHIELKRKLKEVEEEIFLKNGEIRVLRDSLKTAQQEKEAQRQNQALVETQKLKEQSEKEKELSRKVQSLQSELQFKEAEINEMKSKLHSSDRKNSSPLARNSPKGLNSVTQLHHGSSGSSSSPSRSGFITKETFGAQVVSRITPVKTSTKTRRDGGSRSADRQEVSHPDPFLSVRRPNLQQRGGALLGLLLQQPLFPSSLGLSHLLSLSLTDTHRTSRLSAAVPSSSKVIVGGGGASGAALSPVQSLAMTGLNLLSQSNRSSSSCSSCPGSVLLLPLLQLHLSQLCHALDSLCSTATATGSVPACRSASPGLGRLEDTSQTGFSVDEGGLAALRILYLLLTHSDEVVQEVLTEGSWSRVADKKAEGSTADMDPKSQSSLLQCVLRLCDASVSLKEELICNAMKTLSVLIERTPKTNADKLQCVLQQVCICVSADSRLGIISQCVSILSSMSDHQTLTHQLCSQHDPCVFLKLFQFIRSRPDQKVCHTDWILLDLQIIRLLSRLLTQRAESWTNEHSSCQCHTELVQTVVIVFHRQWLDLRDSSDLTPPPSPGSTHSSSPWWCGPAASLLRECLLLLHWLLLHHGRFSDSCRPLLHMYDQVIPAVRDTLRRIPGLSESEELALEEICRSDGDDADDMDTDPSS